MSTIRTRFCSSRPSTHLKEITLMFLALILQYLNKLVKGEVGDFASPQAFHTLSESGYARPQGRQAYCRDAHSLGVLAVGTCMFCDAFSFFVFS